MEKSEFRALVERYKNEMIDRFNLSRDTIVDDNIAVESSDKATQDTQAENKIENLENEDD